MDENLKKGMELACKEMGLSMTTAFTIFATKVSKEKRIPFEVAVSDYNLRQQARNALAEAFKNAQAQSVVNGTDNMTMEEIDAEIAECRKEMSAGQ